MRHPSRAAQGEAFRFAVGNENSFSVEQRLFRKAGWVVGGTAKGSLRVYLGAAVLQLDTHE